MQQPESGSGEARRRRRVVRSLTAAVVAYWVALAAIAIGPPVRLYMQLRRQWPGHVTLGVSDQYGFAVVLNEQPVWQATLSWLSAAAWIIGPPLVLWALWLLSTRRRAGGSEIGSEAADGGGAGSVRDAPSSTAALNAG